MQLLMFRAQAYCQLYESLTRNPNPTDDTRQAVVCLESHITTLADDISTQEELNTPKSTTQDDDIPF